MQISANIIKLLCSTSDTLPAVFQQTLLICIESLAGQKTLSRMVQTVAKLTPVEHASRLG